MLYGRSRKEEERRRKKDFMIISVIYFIYFEVLKITTILKHKGYTWKQTKRQIV